MDRGLPRALGTISGSRAGPARRYHRALPDHAPEDPEPFDAIMADFSRILLPGITHWNSPNFFAYFAITGSAPGVLAEFLVGGAEPAGDAVAYFTGRDGARSRDARMAAAPDRPARIVRGCDLRHRLDRDDACAGRGTRGGDCRRSRQGAGGPIRCASRSDLLFGPDAFVDRQSGDRHRAGP